MRGIEFWAKTQAQQYPDGREREVAYASYLAGARDMRELCAGMIEDFGNQKFVGVPMLLRVIGQGEVGDDGKPKEY